MSLTPEKAFRRASGREAKDTLESILSFEGKTMNRSMAAVATVLVISSIALPVSAASYEFHQRVLGIVPRPAVAPPVEVEPEPELPAELPTEPNCVDPQTAAIGLLSDQFCDRAGIQLLYVGKKGDGTPVMLSPTDGPTAMNSTARRSCENQPGWRFASEEQLFVAADNLALIPHHGFALGASSWYWTGKYIDGQRTGVATLQPKKANGLYTSSKGRTRCAYNGV